MLLDASREYGNAENTGGNSIVCKPLILATDDFICLNVPDPVIDKPDIPKPTADVSNVLRITTIRKRI